MSWGDSPLCLRVALFLGLLAYILQITAVASMHWIDINETTSEGQVDFQAGLWGECSSGICVSYTNVADWLSHVRTLEISAIGLFFGAIIDICATIWTNADSTNLRKLKISGISISFTKGTVIIIGANIYKNNFEIINPGNLNIIITNYISWSFWLCITAGALSLLNGFLIICSFRPRQ